MMIKKITLFPCVLLAEPKVQVYSRNIGVYGQKNVLICYASGFHPPDITIDLLKDGNVIPGATQTDLAFEQGWDFHLTKYVEFLPQSGQEYTCRVRHLATTKTYTWGTKRSDVHMNVLRSLFVFRFFRLVLLRAI